MTANNKGADQTVWMPRMICTFDVLISLFSLRLVYDVLYELHHERNCFLHMRKQRRRSAAQFS